ncbi:MAG TPA: carboxypeptidase-like regulatory domain-containing protein [Candidatus Thermoplasmatota archaeon]|nr:carboxypeptidase-like regulatory domain-containing protein [Candidatus Thermoplasmatota archaeon]
MNGLRVPLALALCVAALAGCASKASSDPTEKALEGVTVAATATTGVVRGLVVDSAVRPLAGVELALRAGSSKVLHTNSTATGAFGFQGLEAGTYFIKATKAGYTDVQTSVEVVAGESNPPITRVSMAINPSARPFVETFVFKGFIDCSVTTVVVGAALCAIPNVVQPNTTNDNTQVHYQPQRVPDWAQSEMVWKSTQNLGESLSLMYSWDCGETLFCDHQVRGTSPLLLTANQTAIAQIGMGNSTDTYIRVFNTYNDATAPPPGTCAPEAPQPVGKRCPRGVGLTLEQEFTIYTHLFYGFQPPEGYRFSADGSPPAPPA